MTWREWKDWIEGAGVKDEDEIAYIDCEEPIAGRTWKDADGEWRIA